MDGGKLIRSFWKAGLIEELTLSVIPVVLGRGIPLFGPEVPETLLCLQSSQGYPSGLVELRYRVLGAAAPQL